MAQHRVYDRESNMFYGKEPRGGSTGVAGLTGGDLVAAILIAALIIGAAIFCGFFFGLRGGAGVNKNVNTAYGGNAVSESEAAGHDICGNGKPCGGGGKEAASGKKTVSSSSAAPAAAAQAAAQAEAPESHETQPQTECKTATDGTNGQNETTGQNAPKYHWEPVKSPSSGKPDQTGKVSK